MRVFVGIDQWESDSLKIQLVGVDPGEEPDWFGMRRVQEQHELTGEADIMALHHKRIAEAQALVVGKRKSKS